MKTQRQEKKKYDAGSKTAMTIEKIQHLEDLDFVWHRDNAIWNQRFEELQKYAEEHNGQLPRQGESKLGIWIYNQKCSPKARVAHSAERKAKLRSISSFFGY